MDMCFWWLRCHTPQDQFRYYWDTGSKNWADYHTKHHPDTYHKAHQSTHAGIWDPVGTYTLPPIMPSHWPAGFPLQVFPFYFLFPTDYYPHIRNVAARVCRSPDSLDGQTISNLAHVLANTT
jgi:hypothetical protein